MSRVKVSALIRHLLSVKIWEQAKWGQPSSLDYGKAEPEATFGGIFQWKSFLNANFALHAQLSKLINVREDITSQRTEQLPLEQRHRSEGRLPEKQVTENRLIRFSRGVRCWIWFGFLTKCGDRILIAGRNAWWREEREREKKYKSEFKAANKTRKTVKGASLSFRTQVSRQSSVTLL